jgi:hypothetical protein
MIEIPHEPEKLLKWLIGFFIFLWIVWFFTGGPERFDKQKPFLKPPPPLDTGETYGPR